MSYETDMAYMRMQENMDRANEMIAREAMQIIQELSSLTEGSNGSVDETPYGSMQEAQDVSEEQERFIETQYEIRTVQTQSETESISSEYEEIEKSMSQAGKDALAKGAEVVAKIIIT